MIYELSSYTRRYQKLTQQQQYRVDNAVERFLAAFGRPHQHGGIGLRPVAGLLEFRAGLDLRILVRHKETDLYLVFVGTHNEVQAFIRNI